MIHYGSPGDTPVTGDWNHDGTTDIGVYENGWWYLRNSLTPGPPDMSVAYGAAGYVPVTGAWTTGGQGIADVVQH